MKEILQPRNFETEHTFVEKRDWGWVAYFKPVPKTLKDKLRGVLSISKDDGTLGLTGELQYAEPGVQQLFADMTILLQEHGIDIPKPNPAYQRLEELVTSVSPNAKMNLNKEKITIGDHILLKKDDYSHIRDDSDYVFYIGTVKDFIDAPWSVKVQNWLPVNLSPAFRIDYGHFTPQEQHISKIYEWRHSFPDAYTGPDIKPWFPQLYRVDKEFIQEIDKEATPHALPQEKHPTEQHRGFSFP